VIPQRKKDDNQMNEQTEEIRDILDDVDVCMLVDTFQAGLRARPMALHFDDDEDEALWFVTDTDSGKVDEVTIIPSVCVSVLKGRTYASITGDAQIVDDRAKLKDIWNTFFDAWYPDGPDSPDVTLLKVMPRYGEYWKEDAKAVAGIKILIASAKGERPDLGENEKVKFA